MRHPQMASVLSFPPPRTRERSELTLTLTPLHSEYQGRCHGIRPITRPHPPRYPSKPQATFIATFWRTSENSSSRDCLIIRNSL